MEFMRVDITVPGSGLGVLWNSCMSIFLFLGVTSTYFRYFSTFMDLPVSGVPWILVQEGRFWVGNHLFLAGLAG